MKRYALSDKQAAAVTAAIEAAVAAQAMTAHRDALMREAVVDYGVSAMRLCDEMAMPGLSRDTVARIARRS
ncbi:exported hypothetical protein [Nostocoides japonicum T1-X7]|uniref:Uncharacterized protein n=1 Tax=Nostocoides japonicum T1-X7 TaxID=1194083 RepID=A0A077M4M9_9MICO|nr:hypothetical protein [Tetrasphaera japonica]CCH79075.1 exported hypothetical protein [Tetrasphaera japonica T1-X7]